MHVNTQTLISTFSSSSAIDGSKKAYENNEMGTVFLLGQKRPIEVDSPSLSKRRAVSFNSKHCPKKLSAVTECIERIKLIDWRYPLDASEDIMGCMQKRAEAVKQVIDNKLFPTIHFLINNDENLAKESLCEVIDHLLIDEKVNVSGIDEKRIRGRWDWDSMLYIINYLDQDLLRNYVALKEAVMDHCVKVGLKALSVDYPIQYMKKNYRDEYVECTNTQLLPVKEVLERFLYLDIWNENHKKIIVDAFELANIDLSIIRKKSKSPLICQELDSIIGVYNEYIEACRSELCSDGSDATEILEESNENLSLGEEVSDE